MKDNVNTIFSLKDVCFNFKNASLFHELNLSVTEPSFYILTGSNGAGKTTLFQLLLGFLSPQSGSIEIGGLPPKKARESIGYIPQKTVSSTIPIKVLDVVANSLVSKKTFGLSSYKKDLIKSEEVLVSLGLADLMRKDFSELSGGQAQQVLLARSIVSPKEILLLDEPMSNTDKKSRDFFYQTLYSLNESGVTIILISHDIFSFPTHKGKMMHLHDQKIFLYNNFQEMESELFHKNSTR